MYNKYIEKDVFNKWEIEENFQLNIKKEIIRLVTEQGKKVTHGEDAFPGKGKLKPEDEEKKDGVACGKNRVSRLMNENNIFSKLKRKYKATTY